MKFVRFAAIAAAIAYLSAGAHAADVATPTPAPGSVNLPSGLPSYPTGSGLFYGLQASGLGGTASSTAGGAGQVIGGKIGVNVGYTGPLTLFNYSTFYFADLSLSGQAINGASNVLSFTSALSLEERVAVGVPNSVWQAVLNSVPGLGSVQFASLPVFSGATFGPAQPYIFGALYQDDVTGTFTTSTGLAAVGKDWLVSYGLGVGFISRASTGAVLDQYIQWKHGAAGMLIGQGAGTTSAKAFNDTFEAVISLKF
jgi:hypothetical protein